ncbi:endoribonuclease Dicer protein [Dioscorea alata]|uniref:Endoribonuclease Dicer protein n=1 Tax=Dioscorea alata TaxID=55571 RepID=A0ACB7WQG9_DIOAL|nr:endoribonuclease Dicer protein [Dioscorea alata]
MDAGEPPQTAKVIKDFTPRSYQRKVFEVAMRRNTIAVLETGAGKTMIAVMLMREIGREMREKGEKLLMIFLAPTVHLVNQQFCVIKDYTDFRAREYYGSKGVDEWTAECWEKEIESCEIMVMTPQILLDALRNAFLTLGIVRLIVFDECHRASGNHPYRKIMKEFYHISRIKPIIFGTTASPVIRKGVSSVIDCEEQISELESVLDSKVFTVEDRTELEVSAPSAMQTIQYYDANKLHFGDLDAKLECLFSKANASFLSLEESFLNHFKDTDDILKTSRMTLAKYHANILYCLCSLGLICACEAAEHYLEKVRHVNAAGECDFSGEINLLFMSYLEELLFIIKETLPHDYEGLLRTEHGYLEGGKMGLISPKLDKLVQIFQSFGLCEGLQCLIFVERIIMARVIEVFMKKVKFLSHFSISYLTGGSSTIDSLTPMMQKTTLDLFRSRKVNLLFTTDVAEEGIHIPNCCCVIRFDLPKTVRSYVQSRGRARQSNSIYILMIERGNNKEEDQLFDIIQSEQSIMQTALCRDSLTDIFKFDWKEDLNAFYVKSTGARVTPDSSVSLIYKYCERLPKDKYFTPKPIFNSTFEGGRYQCSLTLPPNAAFQTIVGPPSINSKLAKQLVSLDACVELHKLGVLNDHLLPLAEEPREIDAAEAYNNYASGAGTSKRKELHGMTRIRALSGTWAHESVDVTLNAYKINFFCNQEGEKYCPFALLLNTILDGDVANAAMDLFLMPNKIVKVSIIPSGQVHLSAEKLKKSKRFQEFFFNGIFGKLLVGSRSSGETRTFLFKREKEIPWSSSNMYLLLPVESAASQEIASFHWKGIDACASVVEYLLDSYSLDGEYENSSLSSSNSYGTFGSEDIVHLANKSIHIQHLRNSVVFAIHTGRIYSVLDVINNVTPESSFDEIYDQKPSKFCSFVDYYLHKYNIRLKYPRQPLLLLKQSHNPHNLLLSKLKYEDGFSGQNTISEKEQVHSHIPPELLVHIDISTDILKSFYLLPSVMHRLESLMLAAQLRVEIGYAPNHSWIPSSLILEAITTLRCCESFSLERLELLGDSVLKYALSCHLFLNCPKKHEGQLSDHRSWAVCNSTLHRLGIGHYLQGYIRDTAFDPRRWVAPGQISLRNFPCECGVDSFEVPIETKFITEETSIVMGKACDKGHRWMCSKTIADCVEALIGAYYAAGGLAAALSAMKWLGINSEFQEKNVIEAKNIASCWSYLPKFNEIKSLESKLAYTFSVKGLLLEAITHPTQQELGIAYCYQRLEFLGDSVLDLLITWYLFCNHTDIEPGELTDMRSASVNNDNFAFAAVRNNLHVHLQHGSGLLSKQITEYVRSISEFVVDQQFISSSDSSKSPKALGDMMESIAGAVLIDSNLNLDKVWEVFKPLLSPLISPDKLVLPPYRELIELSSHIGHGCDSNRKGAKAQAAICLLKALKERGISHTEIVTKKRQQEFASGYRSCTSSLADNDSFIEDGHIINLRSCKKEKSLDRSTISSLSMKPAFVEDESCILEHSRKLCNPKFNEPVVLQLKTEKGGPRTELFKLCQTLQWPLPRFLSTEEKSRTPICLDGTETPHFNTFVSSIRLHIPNTVTIELMGEKRTDKKSSHDSAALVMLRELQKQGICVLKEP